MNHAIVALQVALANAENNEPIHRAEGDTLQADLCKAQIEEFKRAIYNLTCIDDGSFEPATFVGKIAHAVNVHSMEAGSNTPDFIIAEFLRQCLRSFDIAIESRQAWYAPPDPEREMQLDTPPQSCNPTPT